MGEIFGLNVLGCQDVEQTGTTANAATIERGWYCAPGLPQISGTNTCGLYNPGLVKGKCPVCKGDPINALVGNKYQVERDYTGTGPFPLVFERVYNSWGSGPGAVQGFYPEYLNPAPGSPGATSWTGFYRVTDPVAGIVVEPIMAGVSSNSPMDTNWRHNYDRVLNATIFTVSSSIPSSVTLFRADSKNRTFTYHSTIWPPNSSVVWQADPGQLLTKLTQQIDSNGNTVSWTYVNENDETEIYDSYGKLLSISNRAGLTQTLQYDPFTSYLVSVTDPFGRKLTLTYSGQQVVGMVAPDNGSYTYGYTGGNLSSVSYPDNSTRQYLYENGNYANALTGIIDEDGNRFASWAYDAYGNATGSELAGGAESVTLNFSSAHGSSSTDASGATQSYTTQMINGMPLMTAFAESWPNGSRSRSIAYDANGNISSETDNKGMQTNHVYDPTRDLETSRTEAYGTAQARTTTTIWHPTFRLPAVIAEPGRATMFMYDANGNLLTKTITAGANSRSWTYTYDTNGQVLTATGPRTDISNVTRYGYDNQGNLVSITNAVGQVTTLGNYDSNGRVGLITDPNGAKTALTYSPRGWLTSKVVTAGNIIQSTTYNYDSAGQLTQVTLPDNTTVGYTYDAAHRLTRIQDSLGNSINYTLDVMSNRIAETITDPNGTLTRQVSRIFDAVNRVQQVTGAAQ